jgi:hypothetical protein
MYTCVPEAKHGMVLLVGGLRGTSEALADA